MKHQTKHIVIIGAGFAGLKLARELNDHSSYTITLIDKNNYHQFQPLFYQVAMASLDASNISFPLRYIFQNTKNVTIRVASVSKIDLNSKQITIEKEIINYDYLVIASGATTNYFGNEKIEQNVFPMKSTFEAIQIRNAMLQHFENAVTANYNAKKKLLTVAIVGGGPTGVELSGALVEMKSETLHVEYPELNFEEMEIILIEGSPRLLSAMSLKSSTTALNYLEKLGVKVMTNTIVKEYDGQKITLQNGAEIETTFVVWAAGIKGNIPRGIHAHHISPTNQIRTDYYHQIIGVDNAYALGDVALIESKSAPKGYPQVASVAIQQATNLAENFRLLLVNKPAIPFNYKDKGSMATIGRNKAVVDLVFPKYSFQGLFAWLIWMTLHLFLLIGFKNRIIVFINWIYQYFAHKQSLALLFPDINTKSKMNKETELTNKIISLTMMMEAKYPELSKYIDEMPITIPIETHPEVNIENLENYHNSLLSMVDGYKSSSLCI
jgi:NADH dehydrogenase